MHERIHNLVSSVTEGLKDDPELRLDVQAELAAHLEERARDAAAGGLSEEEAAEEAVTAFGAPLDLAAALLESNKGRMKLRALIRLAIKAVLVPAAVVVALLVGYNGFVHGQAQPVRIMQCYSGVNGIEEMAPNGGMFPRIPHWREIFVSKRQRAELAERQVIWPPWSDSDNVTSMRMLWKTHEDKPDGYIYLANYTHLIEAYPFGGKITAEKYHHDFRLGEQIEPRNALYNYRLAQYYFQTGFKARYEKGRHLRELQLLDQQAMEQGITELYQATHKPYLAFHHTAMMQKRLEPLPFPRSVTDYNVRRSICSIEDQLSIGNLSGLTCCRIQECARLLVTQGRVDEAAELLKTWKPIMHHLTSGAETLFHLEAARVIGISFAERAATIYREIGLPDEAQQVLDDSRRFAAPLREKVKPGEATMAYLDKYASSTVLRSYYLRTVLKEFSIAGWPWLYLPPLELEDLTDNLVPTRMFEHLQLEEFAVNLTLTLLLFMLLAYLCRTAIESAPQAGLLPVLLLPSWRMVLRVIVLGVILPLLIFHAYTQIPVLSGRQYGFAYQWPRFTAELLLLMLSLLLLPVGLAMREIHARCRAIGIPIPPRPVRSHLTPIIAFMVLGLLYYLGMWVALGLKSIDGMTMMASMTLVVPFAIILIITPPRWLLRRQEAFALYHKTVAYSLMPICALTIIILAGIASPSLRHAQMHWLRKDRLVFVQPESSTPLPAVEQAALLKYRAEMLRALSERE